MDRPTYFMSLVNQMTSGVLRPVCLSIKRENFQWLTYPGELVNQRQKVIVFVRQSPTHVLKVAVPWQLWCLTELIWHHSGRLSKHVYFFISGNEISLKTMTQLAN